MSGGAGRAHYGQGRVYRPVIHGRKSPVWWLDFYVRGERHRESSGERRKKAAQRVLRDRAAGRESGKIIGRPDRVTLHDLRELVRTDYELNGLRSWNDAMLPSWVGRHRPALRPLRADAARGRGREGHGQPGARCAASGLPARGE